MTIPDDVLALIRLRAEAAPATACTLRRAERAIARAGAVALASVLAGCGTAVSPHATDAAADAPRHDATLDTVRTPDAIAPVDVAPMPDVVTAPDVPTDVAPPSCDPRTNCAGSCVDLATDIAHCGACDVACPAPAGRRAVCLAGVCDVACLPAATLVGATCVPTYRPLAPLSTARVTSLHPTLRWSNPAGALAARVQLCRDRACTLVLADFVARGERAVVPSDLPHGTVFWRLLDPAGDATQTSPTWQFRVGARGAAVDTSWGTTPDVNGDGFDDVLAGSYGANEGDGAVRVYFGGRAGVAATPDEVLRSAYPREAFGFPLVSAGDVNGDGFADVLVGATANIGGHAFLYLGGPTGLATAPALRWAPPEADAAAFGGLAAGVGDVNGDGYGDVVVSSGLVPNSGPAFVYLGGPAGPSTTPSVRLDVDELIGVAAAGDVDGDGYDDIVIGELNGEQGQIVLFRGGPAGPATEPSVSITSPFSASLSSLAGNVVGGMDFNGDGFADVAVGVDTPDDAMNRIAVFTGGPAGLAASRFVGLLPALRTDRYLGGRVLVAGDFDADGYDDLVASIESELPSLGRLDVYRGGAAAALLPAASLVDRSGVAHVASFVWLAASGGDLDADGYDDLLVDLYLEADNGAVLGYRGGATGLPPAPSFILFSPEPSDFFGAGLAVRWPTSAGRGRPRWANAGS